MRTGGAVAPAYIDSSAAVKLIVRERESAALVAVLERDHDMLITSDIGFVEVSRAGARAGVPPSDIDEVLDTLVAMPLDGRVRHRAQRVGPSSLRSLDAIHLASALSLEVDGLTFVAYDERLLEAARAAGLPTSAPGR